MAVLIIDGYSLKTHLSRFGPEIWKKGGSIDRSNVLYSLKIVLKSNQFLTKRRTSASSARHERLWICLCLMRNLSFLLKMSATFLQLTVLKMDSDVERAVHRRLFHLDSHWHFKVHRNTDLFSFYCNFTFRKIHPGSILLRTYDDEGNPVHDHVRNFENNKAKYQTLRFLLRC